MNEGDITINFGKFLIQSETRATPHDQFQPRRSNQVKLGTQVHQSAPGFFCAFQLCCHPERREGTLGDIYDREIPRGARDDNTCLG
ncbi:MAG: hypothetical protein KCHDKBKB_02416 [Elusimicrobia bacterium]|nr:hypothetical protein [Elusimicrobiota bacterium]